METKLNVKQYKQSFLFYGLSVYIPWTFWFISGYLSHAYPNKYVTLTSILSFIGLLAPLALALALMLPNKELRKDLFGRIFNIKSIPFKYLAITLLLMPLSILAAQATSLAFGYSLEQFQLRGSYSFTSGIFPVWFLLIMAPLIEELAWHSYGTDCLRNKFSLLKTSLIFALFWGLWHLPLSSIKDYYHSNLMESGVIYSINFLVSLFPFVIIMNWLYYKTNRSIIIAVIFHISAGYFNEIFMTHPMSKVIQTGLLLLLSIYLIANDKEFFFKK